MLLLAENGADRGAGDRVIVRVLSYIYALGGGRNLFAEMLSSPCFVLFILREGKTFIYGFAQFGSFRGGGRRAEGSICFVYWHSCLYIGIAALESMYIDSMSFFIRFLISGFYYIKSRICLEMCACRFM